VTFDPSTATPASDPDATSLAEWVRGNSPGVKAADRQAAAAGIVAAFKGGMQTEDTLKSVLASSVKVMPQAARKGVRREWYRAQAAAKKSGGAVPALGDFWAAKAPTLLHEKFTGRGSWRAQAKGWLKGATAHVQSTVGLRADDPSLQAMNSLLDKES
jgi:hypothetical protein